MPDLVSMLQGTCSQPRLHKGMFTPLTVTQPEPFLHFSVQVLVKHFEAKHDSSTAADAPPRKRTKLNVTEAKVETDTDTDADGETDADKKGDQQASKPKRVEGAHTSVVAKRKCTKVTKAEVEADTNADGETDADTRGAQQAIKPRRGDGARKSDVAKTESESKTKTAVGAADGDQWSTTENKALQRVYIQVCNDYFGL